MMQADKPIDYWHLEGLDGYYFEDSFVERTAQSQDVLVFTLLVVLTEKHESYHAPYEGEQHCYRKARLEFKALRKATWEAVSIDPAIDAKGSIDFGNIDVFQQQGEEYRLIGSWGEVLIASDAPVVTLLKE